MRVRAGRRSAGDHCGLRIVGDEMIVGVDLDPRCKGMAERWEWETAAQ